MQSESETPLHHQHLIAAQEYARRLVDELNDAINDAESRGARNDGSDRTKSLGDRMHPPLFAAVAAFERIKACIDLDQDRRDDLQSHHFRAGDAVINSLGKDKGDRTESLGAANDCGDPESRCACNDVIGNPTAAIDSGDDEDDSRGDRNDAIGKSLGTAN